MYINLFLTEHCINHIPEYSVHIGNSIYRFDFYLPDYNLFIEYDGIQHTEICRYFKTDEENRKALEKIQYRDKIKNQYCIDNNINLLRIPYYESQNIDNIIINHLQRLNERDFINN